MPDSMPMQGSITATQRLKVDIESKRLEDFFSLMFDERMFETIADRTSDYTRNIILNVTQGRGPC